MRTPLRRHAALVPLSHDHREGLQFCWNIRQGLTHALAPVRIARYANWFWTHHLQAHFQKEEQVLLPCLPAGEPGAARLLTDHADIAAQIGRLATAPTATALHQLADALTTHIRFEERTFFPFVQDQLPQAVLATLVLTQSDACAAYDDPFWLAPKH